MTFDDLPKWSPPPEQEEEEETAITVEADEVPAEVGADAIAAALEGDDVTDDVEEEYEPDLLDDALKLLARAYNILHDIVMDDTIYHQLTGSQRDELTSLAIEIGSFTD